MNLLILFLFVQMGFSQSNLVLNPSFEDTIGCPIGWGAIKHWRGVSFTPDAFNYCDTSTFLSGAPANALGYQHPKEGSCYVGIGCFSKAPECGPQCQICREIIQGTLSSPLKKGKKYCVAFNVSLGDSTLYAINNLQAFLSDTSYFYFDVPFKNFQMPFSDYPQITNNGLVNPLTDKIGWTKVEGSFIATGGEKYILIGNFNMDEDTDTVFVPSTPSTNSGMCYGYFSYYYIDNVSVYCCDPDSCLDAPSEIKIYPNPNNGSFSLEYYFEEGAQGTVDVINSLGQIVFSQDLKPYTYKEDLILNVKSGLYWISVKINEEEVLTQKIVVQK